MTPRDLAVSVTTRNCIRRCLKRRLEFVAPDSLAHHRQLIVHAAHRGVAGTATHPPDRGPPTVRHRPDRALGQQRRRTRNPHAQTPAEGLRRHAHTHRCRALRRPTLLPRHHWQTRDRAPSTHSPDSPPETPGSPKQPDQLQSAKWAGAKRRRWRPAISPASGYGARSPRAISGFWD